MEYQEYIKLGFTREDMSDPVEYRQTGFSGYALSKQINDRISVEVCSGGLDKPKLYIRRGNSETYHILPISTDVVKDMFKTKDTKGAAEYTCGIDCAC